MYIPGTFREDDLSTLQDFMRQFSFATLITHEEGGSFATHLPVLLDADQGLQGTLRAHMARANPQWRGWGRDREALVIFQGPHAYISPSWYEVHPSVPTWNYTAVHAYGRPRLVDDAGLIAILRESVGAYEAGFETPWNFEDLTEEYVGKMMQAIVGFEIEITRLEGKFKLSQNRSETDRERVIAALRETGDALSVETAEWMRRGRSE